MPLPQFTPQLQLETLFVLNESGRIVSTREHNHSAGPTFSLIRGRRSCASAVHAAVPDDLAGQLLALARSEPPIEGLEDEPLHASRYLSLLRGRVESGPAFTFPEIIAAPADTVVVTDISQLERHLQGWTADELPECSPIIAIVENGHAVSVCFCARRSAVAAEAGVNTAEPYRGRGLAPRVTAAWALAVRSSGRLPLYSTSWSNDASLAVARKLGLEACASDWNLYSATIGLP